MHSKVRQNRNLSCYNRVKIELGVASITYRSVFKDISIASKMYLTLLQGVFKDASKNVDVWVSRFTRIVSKVYANLLESWRKWFSNLLESCRKCFKLARIRVGKVLEVASIAS